MATLFKIGENSKEVVPKNGKYFSYEELQGFVKEEDAESIEIVPLPNGLSIVVNEMGKLIGLPENKMATEIWKKAYPIADYPHNNDELIVGNALMVSENELEQ